jgi:glycosyltransferase involved in cell wall biosynthesis
MSAASTPITVLYVAWAPFFSGAERALLVLIDNLDRARYRPVVAIGTDGELAAELRARQIQTVHIPVAYFTSRTLPAWSAAVGRLVWLAKRTTAALIHANDVPSFQPAGYAAKLIAMPALTHVRFPDSRNGFGWFLRPGFRHALFVSQALRDDAVECASDLFEARSEVVYDGVQIPPLADDAQRLALRDELGLPREATLVVMAGQVAEIKGIWDFIDAAARLVSENVPVKFVVLGDDLKNRGATREQAEAIVRERGLSEAFFFLGFRPNAQRLIPAFDIVAVPSHVEPLGNATLEAMASARPVVGSRVGGIPEMIANDVTGTLVAPRDPASLADAIAALVHDREKARAYGQAGRRRALDLFSVPKHVAHVQSIYDRFVR